MQYVLTAILLITVAFLSNSILENLSSAPITFTEAVKEIFYNAFGGR